MNNNFNDGYEIYGELSEKKNVYQPMSYEEAVKQRSNHKQFQNKPDYRFPMLEKAARITKLLSALFILIFSVLFILGYATHGEIFLLKKTEATITEVESHEVYVRNADGGYTKTVYDMTLNYEYKGKNITLYATSDYDKSVNGTVYIYVSIFDAYSGWYIDGFGTIIRIVAIGIGICAGLLVAALTFENYGRNKLMYDYDPDYGKSKFYPN